MTPALSENTEISSKISDAQQVFASAKEVIRIIVAASVEQPVTERGDAAAKLLQAKDAKYPEALRLKLVEASKERVYEPPAKRRKAEGSSAASAEKPIA